MQLANAIDPSLTKLEIATRLLGAVCAVKIAGAKISFEFFDLPLLRRLSYLTFAP